MTGCTAPAPGENTYRNVSADEAADIMKEEKDLHHNQRQHKNKNRYG